MAQLRLEPPTPFNFRTPDEWPKWKKRFEQFREASGLAADANKKQVNTLLYCLGEEAEGVLTSTNVTEDERKVYKTVLQKFDDFFKVRRNVIYERARFNRRHKLRTAYAHQSSPTVRRDGQRKERWKLTLDPTGQLVENRLWTKTTFSFMENEL